MPIHTVDKIIQIHPHEADAVAEAFRDAQASLKGIVDRLDAVGSTLDQDWEGRQKMQFLEAFRQILNPVRTHLLPGLDIRIQKYRAYKAEKTVEAVEHF